jgi:hypothetical protein
MGSIGLCWNNLASLDSRALTETGECACVPSVPKHHENLLNLPCWRDLRRFFKIKRTLLLMHPHSR